MSANTADKHWQLQFSLAAIQKVKEEFEKVDAVDETKFIQIVRQILTNIKPNKTTPCGNHIDITTDGSDVHSDSAPFDDDDLGHLFLMIDADSSGTITFKQFSSYLFLSEKAQNPRMQENHSREIFPKAIEAPYSSVKHVDNILFIYRITRRFTYYKNIFLTAAHDGKIIAWDVDTLHFHSVVLTKLDWVTSVVHMRHSHRLVVATTSSIKLYDIINREEFTVRYYDEVPPWLMSHATPMALAYHFDEEKVIEYLAIADHDGIVTVYTFYDNGHAPILLDPRSIPPNIEFKDYTKIQRFKHHSDHITMLKFVPQIGLLATASLDSNIKFFELDRLNKVRIEFRGHEKACNGFVYNERSKLMASCGVERDVLLWSPFSPDNISRLSGHNSSCKCVCSIHGTSEIVSLDVEGIVKVWNLRHQHCLQTVYPGDGLDHARTIYMENVYPMALITASRKLVQWPLSIGGMADQLKESRVPLSHVLYNRNFRQIVTVAQHSSVVKVWSVENGNFVRQITTDSSTSNGAKLFKDLNDITAVALDHGHRRLLLGTHKGNSVTVWNTSNCKCLRVLHKFLPSEVDAKVNKEDKKQSAVQPPNTTDNPPKRKTARTNMPANKSLDKKSNARELNEISSVENALLVEILGGNKGVDLKRATFAAGWDKKVHVWYEQDDNNSAYDLRYSKKIPSDDSHENHSGDIRSLSYCSPTFLATGCSDGNLIIWNFVTGAAYFSYQCSAAITSTIWSERMKLLIATCNDSSIYFFNVRDRPSLYTKYEPNRNIEYTPLQSIAAIDRFSSYLISGDIAGRVQVYHLGNPPAEDDFCTLESHFVAHEEAITGIVVIESTEWPDMFIATCARDGYASVFSLSGTPVGYFGQPVPWDLKDSTTYNTEFSNQITYEGINYSDALKQYGSECSTESKRTLAKVLAQEKTIEENSDVVLPKVCDVWLYADRSENKTTYKVATIVRVDVATDVVMYINGLLKKDDTSEGTKGTITLSEFFKLQQQNARDKTAATWKRYQALSKFIGNVHRSDTGEHYKAMYARLVEDSGQWYLVDTSWKAHLIEHKEVLLDVHGNIEQDSKPLKLHRSLDLKNREQGTASNNDSSVAGATDLGPKEMSGHIPPILEPSKEDIRLNRKMSVFLRDPHIARKKKWYDEKSDSEVLLALQEKCNEGEVRYAPRPPPVKKDPTKSDKVKKMVEHIKHRKRIFKPTNRRPIIDKRGIYSTGAVARVYKQKDLKKARMKRMKNVVGMQYALPDI